MSFVLLYVVACILHEKVLYDDVATAVMEDSTSPNSNWTLIFHVGIKYVLAFKLNLKKRSTQAEDTPLPYYNTSKNCSLPLAQHK